MVISVRRDEGEVYEEQAEDTLTGSTHAGTIRVSFVSVQGRIVGAVEMTPDEAEFVEGAIGRARERLARKG